MRAQKSSTAAVCMEQKKLLNRYFSGSKIQSAREELDCHSRLLLKIPSQLHVTVCP